MSILCRHVSITVETSRQLSLRTVYLKVIGELLDECFRENAHLNSLCVHFVIFLCFRPIESCVSLFADKQIREVDFFKLEIDWLDKFGCDEGCSLGSCATTLVLSSMIAKLQKGTHQVP